MNYEEFIEYVKNAVDEACAGEHKVQIRKVVKNNGCEYRAVMIIREDEHAVPTIYLEEFYDKYQMGVSLDVIVSEIIDRDIRFSGTLDLPIEEIFMFDKIRDRIRCRIVNAETNSEILPEIPHRIEQDLAIEYYILVDSSKYGVSTALIYNDNIERWNVTEEELFEIALQNMKDEASILDIYDIFSEELPETPGFAMYIVTNQRKIFGDMTIFLPDVLEKILDMLGDFYILPSSVHEVIVLAAENVDDEGYLLDMVWDVNSKHVAAEEFLSNNVYRYRKCRKSLELIKKIKSSEVLC